MGNSRLLQLFVAILLTMNFVFPVEVLAATSLTFIQMRPCYQHATARRTIVKSKTAFNLPRRRAQSKRKHPVKRAVAPKTVGKKALAKRSARGQRKLQVHKAGKHRRALSGRRKKLVKKPGAKKLVTAATPGTRYAYPAEIFIWTAPTAESIPLSPSVKKNIAKAFDNGLAGSFSPQHLVEARVFEDAPMYGGIFIRRQNVRFVVIHSTETERPADALRVIHSWNRGMRHPGAQYVVDRDGKIYQTVDPQFATVHVNIFKAQGGVNNDNSVGIEIVRAGKQKYTDNQLESLTKLVSYTQSRFDIPDDNVVGHGQIQPSDRSDPVNFDWTAFSNSKSNLKMQSLALKRRTQSWIYPVNHEPKPYDGPRPTDVLGPAAEEELDEFQLDELSENI